MLMRRTAPTDFAISALIANRWSPLAFTGQLLPDEIVFTIMEAARWAPSSFNEQPWHFVLALRQDKADFERVLGLLSGKNQRWAAKASVLGVALMRSRLSGADTPNPHASHDLGQAMALMSLQATELGLGMRQLEGFDTVAARTELDIDGEYEPLTAFAIGPVDEPDTLPEDLLRQECAPRKRRPVAESVSFGTFGESRPFALDPRAEDVLQFWLGELDEDGMSTPECQKRWWTRDESFDAEIYARFGDLYDEIASGACEHWLLSARERVAYCIVLDQFSRNMFRGTSQMYATDEQAVEATLGALESGVDQSLALQERVFLYMPLMHSEDLSLQELSVDMFEGLADEAPERVRDGLQQNAVFAIKHRDIVIDWGRFPHRNEILGRTSTPEEIEFLKQPGSSF